jgi:hypothetical protein
MDTPATEHSRLRIRRLRAQYLVSREHLAPERVKARLDEAVMHDLVDTLSTALGPLLSQGKGGLWLIRRLEVEVDVNAAWERDTLTRAWAVQIVRALRDALHDGEDGVNALWFPDRAAYLARFLADVSEGHAWSKWQYEAFEGLRSLPTSATLRTAICDQPAMGRAALLRLSSDELTKTIRTLTTQDARRILDSLAEDAPAGEEFRCFQAAWSVWDGEAWGSSARDEATRDVLCLYLAASRGSPDVGGIPLRTAALALLRLAQRLVGGSTSCGEKLLTALTGDDMADLYVAAGTADAEGLVPLLRCPPEWVWEVGRTLLARSAGHAPADGAEEAAPPQGPRYTSFGGVFVLLPLLDELPLIEATQGWPDAGEIPAEALLRFLLLVKGCGQPRAPGLFYDPLIRDLLGIPPTLSVEVVADWQAGVSGANQCTFLDALKAWHAARAAVQGRTLVLARIRARGNPVAVLIDGAHGIWLFAGAYSPRRPERVVESLRGWLSGGAQEETVLLSDQVFLDVLRTAFPEGKVVSLADDAARVIVKEDRSIIETLARLDKLPEDLSYLSLPPSWGLGHMLNQMLSVGAQGLLRAFAWRLPGFAGSNLPYLYANFLDFTGSVEEEPARRVVRLGRPPLHLVLNITGMARSTYTVSWLDERPFALFPEG